MIDVVYGTCALLCNQPLTDHQVLFDQRIERMEYIPMGPPDVQETAIVLYSEDLASCCSTDCADLGVQKGLQDRGINKTGTSIDPMTSCAKCDSIVDIIQPYAHYVKMEDAINKTSAQTIMTVLHSEGPGDICFNCYPDGANSDAYQHGEPIPQRVVLPVLA